ncbi:MAG: PilZ domain-containing protein [Candidatus Omnitrophica bacterium]|nr:PilZ domain-containing protein [Candidatus Omnitrophota bacterium]
MMPEGMLTGRERRKCRRVSYSFPVQSARLPPGYSSQFHNLITKDISEGGIQLDSFYFYPVEHKLMFEVFWSNEAAPVQTLGRVVWVKEVPFQQQYSIGIEFSDLSKEQLQLIKKIVDTPFNG